MWTNRRLALFLLCYGILLLAPVWQLNLIESTEARYGEIAREMLASGNFLEPTFNGIFHFHKPPLPYWCMAAGMAIFGVNDFGVRFFGIIAALLALFFLHRTALILFGDRRQAFAAALTLASSLLFIAISRTVSTDIYLTCCVMGAQYFLFRQVYGRHSSGNAAGYGLLLGIGFMVKGPVVFLFTLLPQLAAKLVDKQHRRLFSGREIMLGIGIFLAVALPWYVAVTSRHPELLAYFTRTQTVDRVATENFGRNKPFWYFLLLFPATFAPYTVPLLRGGWRYRECPPQIRALFLYILLPLLVFCLSKSKLPPYILPFYGTAALLAVYCHDELRSEWDDRLALAALLVLAAGIGSGGYIFPLLKDYRLPLVAAGVALSGIIIAGRRLLQGDRAIVAVSCSIIAISLAAILLFPRQMNYNKGHRAMVARMNELDPEHRVPALVYKNFLPSISFYRQELAIMALGRIRELGFEQNAAYRQWYIDSEAELLVRVAQSPRLFVVSEPKEIGNFMKSSSFACSELLSNRRYTAYDCRLPANKGK